MAKVWQSTDGGQRQEVRLAQHRVVRIGRDASNDLVLRDPKASRVHAQIVFERGFYVLRDLGSANGTWIGGQRINTAPLTDGAEFRIGSSFLVFSEEVEEQPERTVAARLMGDAEADRPGNDVPLDREDRAGAPQSSRVSDPVTSLPPAALPRNRSTAPAEGHLPSWRRASVPDRQLIHRRLLIDDVDADSSQTAVRNDLDQPLLWFHAPRSAVAALAAFVGTLILTTGIAVSLFLLYERAWLPAIAAILLAGSFAAMAGSVVPRRAIPVWNTPPPSTPLMTIRQEGGLPLPRIRLLVENTDGSTRATIDRLVFPAAGRRVWRLRDATGEREIARASEDSLFRSLLGRAIGGSIRALRTNYEFRSAGTELATLNRSRARPGRLSLELSGDSRNVDRELLLAMALVIASLER